VHQPSQEQRWAVITGGTCRSAATSPDQKKAASICCSSGTATATSEIPSASPDVPPPRISAASAELIKPEWENIGALVVGRHLYDMTNAWGGRHPMNVTTVVLTHRRPDDRPEDDENFVFVTDGIEAAVAKAKELAGDKNVAVNGGQVARQCLEAGLLDEVGVELVPVVLGGGTPLFAELAATPVQFEGPVAVVEGTGVTHLRYWVKK
jgi:dihydrofolate reductase